MRRFTVISLLSVAAACSEQLPIAPSYQRAGSAFASQLEMNQKDAVELFLVGCNGEGVAMTGVVHQMLKFTTAKSGNVSAFVSADYNLSGTGATTGARYNATLHIRDQEMVSDNASGFHHRTSLKLVGQGSVPNSAVDFTVHVVIANGQTRVENVDFSTRCDP